MFSANYQLHERLYKTINDYNINQPIAQQIKFLHGSSSAVFGFIGRKVSVLEKGSAAPVLKTIPAALIPTGILRKKYGVYPISGELEINAFTYGSRKSAINYKCLSGVGVTYDGISIVCDYANHAKRFADVNVLRKKIKKIIKYMTVKDYLRSLKMLVMEMTNLMLLDNEASVIGKNLLASLTDKYATLHSAHPENSDLVKYFNKYGQQLNQLVANQSLPFVSDDAFRKNIFEQYPIIFCSTETAMDFQGGVPGEKLFRGELDFSTVKFLFTPFEHVNDLKIKLTNIGVTSGIQVIGYQANLQHTVDQQVNQNMDIAWAKMMSFTG